MNGLHALVAAIGYGWCAMSSCWLLARFFFVVLGEVQRALDRAVATRALFWSVLKSIYENRVATEPLSKREKGGSIV